MCVSGARWGGCCIARPPIKLAPPEERISSEERHILFWDACFMIQNTSIKTCYFRIDIRSFLLGKKQFLISELFRTFTKFLIVVCSFLVLPYYFRKLLVVV